jgi:hypothetical protein
MESTNESSSEVRIKRLGTREEVFKGLASRTAGGLKKDDIIAKEFGHRTLYISKRLSDRMRENFQHAHSFRKRIRKTLVASNNTSSLESNNTSTNNTSTNNTSTNNTSTNNTSTNNTPTNNKSTNNANNANIKIMNSNTHTNSVKAPHGKTQKLSFKVHDNPVKNVYYKELNGLNLQKLKEELKQEEVEEDLGILNTRSNGNSGEFKIEDVPEISLDDLE